METCSLHSLKLIFSYLDTQDLLFRLKYVNKQFKYLLENVLVTSPPRGGYIGYTPETYFYCVFPNINRLDIRCQTEVFHYNNVRHEDLTYETLFFKRANEPDKWKNIRLVNILIEKIGGILGHQNIQKYSLICKKMPYRLPNIDVDVYGRADNKYNLLLEFNFKGLPGYRICMPFNTYRYSEKYQKVYYGLPHELKYLTKYVKNFFEIKY